jgi:putative peptide zinc metalloprotease protein
VRLPPLREDVQLQPGPPTHDGAPSWTVYDPALHRFLRIGRLEFEILCRWGLGRVDAIADAVRSATTFAAQASDVMAVLAFAQSARLLQPQGDGGVQSLVREDEASRLSPAMWLLKNYLFLRMRLVNPDRFLAWMIARLGWLYTPRGVALLGVLAVVSIYLIGQQWDTYTHSFHQLFTLEGIVMIAMALAFAKAIHELGHGLMARRFGCRVPAMGFALLVLWPMLWTDVTDAWRLTDRHKRLLIDSAGILAELVLAIVASFAWGLLPDGPARNAAFLLSGSTWVITIVVNLNPLMRFDGYFILSDLLDEPNLQTRAFVLGRWWLRELLFGFGDAPPEALPAPRRRLIVAYAVAVWIYRFTLFLGIAFLVYHVAFKLLGLFLMAVEVGWFLIRPIGMELITWPRRLRSGGWPRRSWLTGLVCAGGLVLLVTPWHTRISAPALLRADRQLPLLTAEPGQLVQVSEVGRTVKAGEPLFTLESPDTSHEEAAALADIAGLRARLAGQAFDTDSAQDVPLTWQQLEGALARLRNAQASMRRLVVRAPFDGVLVDVPRGLDPGVWVPRQEHLGMLVDFSRVTVDALVDEADVGRVHPGATARFLPEDGEPPIKLTVRSVSPGALADLDEPELASLNGGSVPVRPERNGTLQVQTAVYRVTLATVSGSPVVLAGLRRGVVDIQGDEVSPLNRIWRRAAAIVMREAGL